MTPEREKELLGLIEAYWRIARPGDTIEQVPEKSAPEDVLVFRARVTVRPRQDGYVDMSKQRSFPAAWAESEACLREVAGECAVREADIPIRRLDSKFVARVEPVAGDASHGTDASRPVALLRAFVSAFGGKEPPR